MNLGAFAYTSTYKAPVSFNVFPFFIDKMGQGAVEF